MNEGPVSTELGMVGIPNAAEDVMVARDIILAELTGGHLHVAHVSTARSLELIREARARGLRVTTEVTPHHFTLTDASVRGYDPAYKMAPPLRSEADRLALIAGLRDGTVDAIASDHAPHYEAELQVEFDAVPFGIVGLETAVPLAIDRLVHGGILSLAEMIAKFTEGPARILGVPGGTLTEGSPGDVTLLDPERMSEVRPERFESRGRNTPFEGWKLKGRAAATVVGGKIVMNNMNGNRDGMTIAAGEGAHSGDAR
jgi:dihydroorotase